MSIHEKNNKFKCNQCHKSFPIKYYLASHIRIVHTTPTKFKCDLCHKAFHKQSEFERHRVVHSDSRPYKCQVCNHTTKYKSSLKKHMKSHYKQEIKCKFCEVEFHHQRLLISHIREIHPEELNFKCTLCDKLFDTKSNLGKHLPTHSEKSNYQCDKCSTFFKFKQGFVKHMKKHLV